MDECYFDTWFTAETAKHDFAVISISDTDDTTAPGDGYASAINLRGHDDHVSARALSHSLTLSLSHSLTLSLSHSLPLSLLLDRKREIPIEIPTRRHAECVVALNTRVSHARRRDRAYVCVCESHDSVPRSPQR